MSPMPAGYKVLPLVYDRWQRAYGKDYSTLIAPRVLATVRRFEIPVSSMMDLACGTGTLAFLMARCGWKVWGVDASEGMIAAAKAKRRHLSRRVTFLVQDMREVRLPEKVALVTSMFDSLNHLPALADLRRTFDAVYANLLPGGYFVFDVNNLLCFTTLWKQTETIRSPRFTMVLENSYRRRQRTAQSVVTLTLEQDRKLERLTEVVRERYFAKQEIRRALASCGFRVRECDDFNFTAASHIGKIKTWWVAQK